MEVCPAGSDDVDAVIETITLAFRLDPVWRPALALADGRDGHMREFWRIYVEGGLRHGTVYLSSDAATVSVWIPPGESELSADQEDEIQQLAFDLLDAKQAQALVALWQRFDENHPREQPHAYLSLLARHPESAGHGHGQAHLEAALARWDASGVPTYLESSNPTNNHRYHRHGYSDVGQFRTILDDAVVTTMWRPAH